VCERLAPDRTAQHSAREGLGLGPGTPTSQHDTQDYVQETSPGVYNVLIQQRRRQSRRWPQQQQHCAGRRYCRCHRPVPDSTGRRSHEMHKTADHQGIRSLGNVAASCAANSECSLKSNCSPLNFVTLFRRASTPMSSAACRVL